MAKIRYFEGFSGMGTFSAMLKKAGLYDRFECVGFSEIDPHAIACYRNHFPEHKNLGDISKIDAKDLPDIDLFVGGFPCPDLSIAKKNRQGLSGARSGLFWPMTSLIFDLARQGRPIKYLILENVASMPDDARDLIDDIMGFEAVEFDAALLSAQSRRRYFWCGVYDGEWSETKHGYRQWHIELPEDKGIVLGDITEDGANATYSFYNRKMSIGKTTTLGTNPQCQTAKTGRVVVTGPVRVGQLGNGGQGDRIYSLYGKSVTLSANGGGRGAKTGLYEIEPGGARKLTPIECERLQGVRDDYTKYGNYDGVVKEISDTQRYRLCGNAFHADVVSWLIEELSRDNVRSACELSPCFSCWRMGADSCRWDHNIRLCDRGVEEVAA